MEKGVSVSTTAPDSRFQMSSDYHGRVLVLFHYIHVAVLISPLSLGYGMGGWIDGKIQIDPDGNRGGGGL